MAVFVNDTFTDTNATSLTSHVGETGAVWTRISGTAVADIYNNRMRPVSGDGVITASGLPGSADCSVAADFYAAATLTTEFVSMLARVNADASRFVRVDYYAGPGVFQLFEVVDGSTANADAYTDTGMRVSGTTRRVQLTVVGAAAYVTIDNVLRLQLALATVTGSGSAGVRVWGASNLHFAFLRGDTFDASDFDTSVSVAATTSADFDTSASVAATTSADFDTLARVAGWYFFSGSTYCGFTLLPRRGQPARTRLPQTNSRASDGNLYVYAHGFRIINSHALDLRVSAAELTDLLSFHRSTVRGRGLAFVWKDHTGTQRTVKFADRRIKAEPLGPGQYRVIVNLDELA